MLKVIFPGLVLVLLLNPWTQAWIASLYVVNDGWQQADVVVALRGDPEEQQRRTEEAARLVKKNYAPVLILDVFAKPIFGQRQAELEQQYLEKQGFPAQKIRLCENAADSTAEEAQALRACFQQWGVKQAIVVTSEYHTRRSRFIFRKVFSGSGIVVGLHPVQIPEYWDPHWWRRRRWAKTFISESLKIVWTVIEFSARDVWRFGTFTIPELRTGWR